jgi:Flp pilus assembly protein TadG
MQRKNLGRLPERHSARAIHPGRSRDKRGQALVELALIMPILMLLLLATIDLGRLFYSQITVTNSAREGAIEASINPTSYSNGACNATTNRVVCAATNESRNSFVTVAAADVSLTCTPSCTKAYGNRATVTVNGHFSLLTPLMWAFTGGPNVTLASTATADIVVTPTYVAATPTPTPSPTPTPTPNPSPTPTPTPAPTPTPTPSCSLPFSGFTYTQQNKNKPVVVTSISTPTSGTCAVNYWRWDWGDSTTDAGNLPSASHQYALQGHSYVVTLTVTNPAGVTSSIQTVVTQS